MTSCLGRGDAHNGFTNGQLSKQVEAKKEFLHHNNPSKLGPNTEVRGNSSEQRMRNRRQWNLGADKCK